MIITSRRIDYRYWYPEEHLCIERIEDEFGDLLFALINYSRFININPEDALEKTNKRFIKRFQILESMVKNQEKEFSDLSFEEMNLFWEKAKKISE